MSNYKIWKLKNWKLFRSIRIIRLIWILFFLFSIFYFLSPSKAMAAASLSLSPATKTVEVGSNFTVNVIVNTGGANTDSTDVILTYDSAKLSLVSSTLASLYDTSMENTTSVTGRITLRQVASAGSYYNGTGTFATLIFSGQAVGAANVNFSFTASSASTTTDSNVSSAGVEILGSVSNGIYTVAPVGTVTNVPEVTGTITPRPTQPVTGGLTPTVTLGIFGTFFMIIGALAILF